MTQKSSHFYIYLFVVIQFWWFLFDERRQFLLEKKNTYFYLFNKVRPTKKCFGFSNAFTFTAFTERKNSKHLYFIYLYLSKVTSNIFWFFLLFWIPELNVILLAFSSDTNTSLNFEFGISVSILGQTIWYIVCESLEGLGGLRSLVTFRLCSLF